MTLGRVGQRMLAFIGLERTGGVMVYDVTSPSRPEFLDYLPPAGTGPDIDLAPEGLLLIPAEENPYHKPLLVVSNEKSGTVTAYLLSVQ